MKNPKTIILSIFVQNIDCVSPDITVPTLNHLHEKLRTVLLLPLFKLDPFLSSFLNLFRSDLPLFDRKKKDKKPVIKFV